MSTLPLLPSAMRDVLPQFCWHFQRTKDWIPLDKSTCFDFVMTVHANLRRTKYQKQISGLGGIRLGEERLITLAQSGRLIDMHVILKWHEGQTIYQVNEDLGNRNYAAWLRTLASTAQRWERIESRNVEFMGDMVEAALGVCHVVSLYPVALIDVLERPNNMWRMLETSIMSKIGWTPTNDILMGKRTKVWNDSPISEKAIERRMAQLRQDPIFSDTKPDPKKASVNGRRLPNCETYDHDAHDAGGASSSGESSLNIGGRPCSCMLSLIHI